MTDAVKMAIERIKARFHPHYGIDGASDSKQLASDCQTLIAALEQAGEPVAADPARDRVILASARLGKWMSAALDDPKVCDEMKADIREWFSAGEPVAGWLPTLQRLGQEFDAGEVKAWLYIGLDGLPVVETEKRWFDPATTTETPLYAHHQSRVAAEPFGLREALEWYGEQARLCRLIHSEGDAGRHALQDDGGKRAKAALATPSQPGPQSREPSDNQIDAAKAKAMDEAADFCIQTLAKALGVDDWEQADGSETWDGDVAGTIYNVLKAGRVYDDEDGRVARLEDAAQSRGQAFDGEGEAQP